VVDLCEEAKPATWACLAVTMHTETVALHTARQACAMCTRKGGGELKPRAGTLPFVCVLLFLLVFVLSNEAAASGFDVRRSPVRIRVSQVPARLLSCLSASTADFHVEATPEAASGLRRAVLQLQEVAAGNLLLNVEFQTIFDYLMVRLPSASRI
jgi:hypothetical protein